MKDQELEVSSELAETSSESAGLSAMDTKLALARRVIAQLKDQLNNLENILNSQSEAGDLEVLNVRRTDVDDEVLSGFEGRNIDGVFDGEHMVGEDGHKYLVPPNYASKSKLVEGDLLRLTINGQGKFLFKQKGPIERQRLVGMLTQDETTGDWKVLASGQRYRVIPAAVSFHKGQVGDDAVILVPKNTPSRWAAIENVVKKDIVSEW